MSTLGCCNRFATSSVRSAKVFIRVDPVSTRGMYADAASDAGTNLAQIYGAAWLQSMCVYYGVAVLLHFVVPAITSPKRVQRGEVQSRGETLRDAARALVPVCLPSRTFLARTRRQVDDALRVVYVFAFACRRPSIAPRREPG